MIAHKHYLDFLFATGLTQAEFLLLYLIYKNDQKYINLYKERFPTGDGTMIGKEQTKRLLDTDWLEVSKDRILKVTNKFREHFVTDEVALGEIIELYPAFYLKDDRVKIPLVTVEKHEYSLKYNRKINYSDAEHREVLKDLQYAIDNSLVTFGLAKFIDSDYWVKIRPMRLGGQNNLEFNFEPDDYG